MAGTNDYFRWVDAADIVDAVEKIVAAGKGADLKALCQERNLQVLASQDVIEAVIGFKHQVESVTPSDTMEILRNKPPKGYPTCKYARL